MGTPPRFYESQQFPYTALLEAHTDTIVSELKRVITHNSSLKPLKSNWIAAHPSYVKGINEISWKTFEFVFFGIKKRSNIEACPETWKLLQQIPELITAQFSVLLPHTHIMPHKGYSKIILRNHLPLVVPPGNTCALRIEDQTHYWEEGKLVVFDDSFEHEAWNRSDEVRAVLMFDIAKPGCGYTAAQICRYKMERVDDPFLLQIAPKETWVGWLEQGYFNE